MSINETQFSGLHLDGGQWSPVTSPGQEGAILAQAIGQRDKLMGEMGGGLSARCCTIVALRWGSADGSSYGNILYMVELAAPPIIRASGVSGLAVDDYC